MRSLPLLALIASITSHAQKADQQQLKKLNNDIWKPFVSGVNNNDSAMYNVVNSKDFYWVSDGASPRIMNEKEYADDAQLVMNRRRSNNVRTEIEIRFLNRTVNNEFASEKCAVKFTAVNPEGKKEVFYSAIRVFSRIENGVWKRWIQYQTDDPVSKEQFDDAIILDRP